MKGEKEKGLERNIKKTIAEASLDLAEVIEGDHEIPAAVRSVLGGLNLKLRRLTQLSKKEGERQ